MVDAIRRFFGTREPFRAAIAKVHQIGFMKPGFNGHNAAVANAEVRQNAEDFLRKLLKHYGTSVPAPTLVAPTSDGGVAIEWRLKNPSEAVEIIILPRGLHEYAIRDLGKGRLDDAREDVPEQDLLNLVKLVVVGRVAEAPDS